MFDAAPIAEVISGGDRRKSLIAVRDRLASELDEERDAKHKRECSCTCGMGDGRVIVALSTALLKVIEELDRLPGQEEETPLDSISDRVSEQRAKRRTATSGL